MGASPAIRAPLRDPTERVVEDDQAAYCAQEFREHALLNQRLAALRMPAAVPGVCTNCQEPCLPLAIYCDAFCREDHEWRLGCLQRGCTR